MKRETTTTCPRCGDGVICDRAGHLYDSEGQHMHEAEAGSDWTLLDLGGAVCLYEDGDKVVTVHCRPVYHIEHDRALELAQLFAEAPALLAAARLAVEGWDTGEDPQGGVDALREVLERLDEGRPS